MKCALRNIWSSMSFAANAETFHVPKLGLSYLAKSHQKTAKRHWIRSHEVTSCVLHDFLSSPFFCYRNTY